MQQVINRGGRGHMADYPAVTHVRLSHRTKHLIYQIKPKDETVDSFIFRLLALNQGNLSLSGYQPTDSRNLFFQRPTLNQFIKEAHEGCQSVIDRELRRNNNKHSGLNSQSRTRHKKRW
jgi:hypothetical protein